MKREERITNEEILRRGKLLIHFEFEKIFEERDFYKGMFKKLDLRSFSRYDSNIFNIFLNREGKTLLFAEINKGNKNFHYKCYLTKIIRE